MKSRICPCGGKVPKSEAYPYRGHRLGCQWKTGKIAEGILSTSEDGIVFVQSEAARGKAPRKWR